MRSVYAIFISLSLLLAACAPGGESARCVPATPAQMAMINAGVTAVAAANQVRTGWAVKSADFANVSMIAARVYGPSMEKGSPPGVWAVGGTPDAPNGMFSVNAFAVNFSNWGDAGKIKAAITLASDGVKAAIWCVENMK